MCCSCFSGEEVAIVEDLGSHAPHALPVGIKVRVGSSKGDSSQIQCPLLRQPGALC